MFLKRLEINGFKSFANTTVFEFLPPSQGHHSITAIVGPNGSGKSNVSDAMRWVLGEQSMKYLRGKKSEDIIFAGSEGKGKMSLASVTMILDNSDHRAGVEYDELVISRRLYRSGESEYVLNGGQVRLFDLQILLAQAQFGQGSYAVIGQGMIDRLLLQTASERKGFFDEAVGIKEFQIKRHHAVLKLEHTEENINQATALLQEIEPRLKSLRRQVNKLEKRQEVELSLRELQEEYYITLHADLKQNISALESEHDSINASYIELSESLSAIQTKLAHLAQEKSRRDIFQELQNEYQTVQREKSALERDYAMVMGKLQTEFTKAGKQNVGWLQNKISELQGEENRLNQEVQVEIQKHDKHQHDVEIFSKRMEDMQAERVALYNRRTELERLLRELREGRDEVGFEGLRAVNGILQQPKDKFGGRVHGIVAQLAHVDEKYRIALEVAAQAHMASIIVEDDGVAQKCIEFLKRQQLGFATFLPLNTIKSRIIPSDIKELVHRPGVYGLASTLVDYDLLFQNIFGYVFGSTLIVENISTARDIGIGRVRMVTLEGDVLESSGSMKGGFRTKRRGALSFAGGGQDFTDRSIEQYEVELKETQKKLDDLEIDMEQLRAEMQGASMHEQVCTQKITLLEQQQKVLVQELSKLKQELSLYSLSPDEYKGMMADLNTEKIAIESNIKMVEQKLQDVQKRLDHINEEEEQKRQRIFALQDEMQTTQQELNKVADKKHTLQVEITKLQTHQEDLEQEIFNELREGVGVLYEKGVERLAQTVLEHTKMEIEKLKYQLSLIGGIDEEIKIEYEETRTRYDTLTADLTDLQKAFDDLEQMIEELDKVMKKKHERAFKEIRKEFIRYFKLLFEGGEADLVEVYGETADMDTQTNIDAADNADSIGESVRLLPDEQTPQKRRKKILQGIEVFACPPGKKIKNIAALSGGERTLTSIALLCAILHTNPSPFVLLDEVEAALDEANTLRFTKILSELSQQSQFIVITHNRVTMHAADVLYGVTMGNDGISKLVSVKLDVVKA